MPGPFVHDIDPIIGSVGGMATHRLLLGGIVAVVLFCRAHRLPILVVTDALAVPVAFILGFGRLGNFVDGQIVGSPTGGWWGVKFPDAEVYRHPVVLDDGLKNFLLVPVMMAMNRLRLATGQVLNLAMRAAGLVLLIWAIVKARRSASGATPTIEASEPLRAPIGAGLWRPAVFAALLVVSLVIPSDWTQDIPERYGKRHPGLQHSALYPAFPAPP